MNADADLDAAARGLGGRLRDLQAAMERLDSFAFRTDERGPAGTEAGDAAQASRDLVLRALRALSDPVNYRLLLRLREGDASIEELMTEVSLPRLGVWERLSDLLQVGLVQRSLEAGRACLAPAGAALVGLTEGLAEAAVGATEAAP